MIQHPLYQTKMGKLLDYNILIFTHTIPIIVNINNMSTRAKLYEVQTNESIILMHLAQTLAFG